jgi:hypothetical protein
VPVVVPKEGTAGSFTIKVGGAGNVGWGGDSLVAALTFRLH